MGMIGDFAAGAGAAGAQMSMDALKATIEEERATRLAEMQNRFQTQRDATEQRFRTSERVGGEQFTTARDATKRAADLEDAPKLVGIKTNAEIRAEREKRALPPAAISEEDKAEKGARADYLKANAERLRAETGAIQRGERYRTSGGAGGTPQSEKDAKLASSEIISLMKGEKDESGAPKYGSQAVMQYAAIASGLVRSGGYSPQEAAQLARSAPIRPQAEITAQLAEEEKKLPRVGMIRGALTGGGVESGDVEVDGKTMKLDDWRKQRGAQIAAEDEKKLAGWARENGIQLAGPRAAANGAPYPDGTVLEKDGEKYEVRDGKPVKMSGAKAPDKPAAAPAKTAAAEPGGDLLAAGKALEETNPELKALGNQMRLMDGNVAASARAAYLQKVRDLQSGRTAGKPMISM